VETYKRVQDGAIGRPLAARCYWNMGQLWYKNREEKWNDMEWMIRDWVNWTWLSGDHICEQHVHNIDVINWFTSSDGTANHPIRAVGFGGRARRVTGNQYDFFSVDFEYAEGFHLASYCRQVNGCDGNVTETVVGEKGETFTQSGVCEIKGSNPFLMNTRLRNVKQTNPYVQEHIDLIDSIVHSKGLNEATNVAISTLTAVMGRIAAYTGKTVTWDEVMDPNNTDPAFAALGPKEYNWNVALMSTEIPVPGRA
jgi:myo-inositol 2-dehydrogenase/D-chiro-inositol 1-dehydrogenase